MEGFGIVLLFITGGLIFVLITLFVAYLIRPNRPNVEKMTTYECGEDPVGTAWGKFNIRFYVIALIFILFDVEIVFLFPWALVFGSESLMVSTGGSWGWITLTEMFVFIAILSLGLAYAWKKKLLNWDKPVVDMQDLPSPVPPSHYEALNKKY